MDLIPYWLKISVLNKDLINTFYAKHTCRINSALTKFEYSIISQSQSDARPCLGPIGKIKII